MNNILELALKKSFGNKFNLDLSLDAGEGITILFGKSGSGKTTILKLISGILTPDEGKVKLNGEICFSSMDEIDLAVHKRQIGFVFQDYALFPHLNVYKNIAFGAKYKDEIQSFLELFEIEHLKNRYPKDLSGGEKQRVAVIRSLSARPKLMLLDEPLSGVDTPTKQILLDELLKIQKYSKTPFIYVTHDISEVLKIGDYVYVIDEGKIVQQGVPIEVFNNPKSLIIAKLTGTENILMCEVVKNIPEDDVTIIKSGGVELEILYSDLRVGEKVTIVVRAEDIMVSKNRNPETSARNIIKAEIKDIYLYGEHSMISATVKDYDFRVRITPRSISNLNLKIGDKIYLLIKAWGCHILKTI